MCVLTSMNLTPQQQRILDHVISTYGTTLVNSVAGSGKTSLLTAIAEFLNPTNALYLAYNKSIADESKGRFPDSVHCYTTHSLAYQNTVADKSNGFKIGDFTYRNIKEPIDYDKKTAIVDTLNDFCLSAFTDPHDYLDSISVSQTVAKFTLHYLELMISGKIDITHAFYLKYFHILLADGDLEFEPFDFIAIDEAGDLNSVTLEIFKLLPSPKKILVGDQVQNIYGFNGTINGFYEMADHGTSFPMTQSFRCDQSFSKGIEYFLQEYIDPSMEFKGVEHKDPVITTQAYLSRYNATLISEMVRCNREDIPYKLVRNPKELFKLPLILIRLKPRGFIPNPTYRFLQEDVDTYHASRGLQDRFSSLFSYLLAAHSDDRELKSAISILVRFGIKEVLSAFEEATKHMKTKCNYTLATSHSTKGNQFDEVTLADDMNDSISDIVTVEPDYHSPDDVQALNLYYVAASRAKYKLNNAIYCTTKD